MTYITGKGNLLDKIHEYNPELAGKYLRLEGDDPDFFLKTDDFMKRNPYTDWILRSDATCEDGIPTFAGLFSSVFSVIPTTMYISSNEYVPIEKAQLLVSDPLDLASGNEDRITKVLSRFGFTESKSVEELKNNVAKDEWDIELSSMVSKAIKIKDYANFRGVDISNAKMNFILHEIQDGMSTFIVQHPNIVGTLHIEWLNGTWDSIDQPQTEQLDSHLNPVVESYNHLIQYLSDNCIIDPDYVYMAEARRHPAHIVQLRPFFKKDYADNHHVEIIGRIPENGLLFEKDEDGNYGGLDIIGGLGSFTYSGTITHHRELDIYKRPTKVIIAQLPNHNGYLSHDGIRNIECLVSFDNSTKAVQSFNKVNGLKTIRYFEKPNGDRAFEPA